MNRNILNQNSLNKNINTALFWMMIMCEMLI